MVDFSDISLAFDDIIDTPAKRRRQVDAASQQIRGRYDQSGHPFALLAGGIAGSIPGITENVRRAGRDMGGRAFQTPGEAMGQQLQGLNPNNPQDRDAILRTVSQSNPAGAAQLESVWREQDMALRASQNRFPIETERYKNGTTWTQTSNGGVIVKGADGVLITGTDDISTAIAAGRQSDIDDAGATAAATAEGTRSVIQLEETNQAVNMALSQVRENDRFIKLIEDEGASGTIFSTYVPEWLRDNPTIEFNQLARQAGLNVIASVTFGALSKAELELAMDTAVPRFTTNAAALNYFRRRKEAQLALAAELSGYLNFQRSNPGKYVNQYEYEKEWKESRQEIYDDRAEQRAAADAALRGDEAAVTDNSDPTGANDTAYQEFLRQNGGSPNGR
tara:strand:+ start:557 stop:1732 length:1176 start_codon:yes stop_codon:yes gene_type:complete